LSAALGFHTTGIFPFNLRAMDEKMGPSEFYRGGPSTVEEEVAAGAPVDLGASENLWKIFWESQQQGGLESTEGGPTSPTRMAMGLEEGSDSEESQSESEQ
jgi:hypothetical protein